jgi:nucleoside-diphosphate-sugar epimerase
MRVCVTGGTGFVGSHAVEAIVRAGHEVRLLARSREKVERVFAAHGTDVPDAVVGDMTDPIAVRAALDGCDAVIHAAAAVEVTGGGGEATFASNRKGTETVLGLAASDGLDPIVHVSTIGVFVPPSSPTITLDSPLASPSTPYSRSKLESERFARALQERGSPVVIVYPGGVFGPDQPTLDSALKGLQGALEQAWPMTTGGLTIIDVRDLAQILAETLERGCGARRLLAGGRFVSWPDLADLCDELTGSRCRRMVMPAPLLRALGWSLDGLKRVWSFDYPLTYEAACFMTLMVPTDDAPTLATLGVSLRDVRETLEDTLRWMVRAGHLKTETAPRLAG